MAVRQCSHVATTTGTRCTHRVDDRTPQCAAGHPNPFHQPSGLDVATQPAQAASGLLSDVEDLAGLALRATVTRHRWEHLPAGFRLGDPADGTAEVLRWTTDRGTVQTPADVVERHQLFDLGPIHPSAEATHALALAGTALAELLVRHARGDWGDVTWTDMQANDRALATGVDLVRSCYRVGAQTILVTTHPACRGEPASTRVDIART